MGSTVNRSSKNPSRMVRAFCKKHRICVGCFRHWVDRDTTRCVKCNRAHSKYQKSLLRRNYERDVKAGICVRCHKRPRTATNKRCQTCQDRHAQQKRQTAKTRLQTSQK
jgi:predicted CXXCH cytochrome family protein